MAHSREVTAEVVRSQSYWDRLVDGGARLLSPLL